MLLGWPSTYYLRCLDRNSTPGWRVARNSADPFGTRAARPLKQLTKNCMSIPTLPWPLRVVWELLSVSCLPGAATSAGHERDHQQTNFRVMSTNPLKQGALVENSTGIGPVSRQMIKERAME